MKKLYITTAVMLLLFIALTSGSAITAKAANDDPGAGRLSGNYTPDEFYTTDTPLIYRYGINQYGSSDSVSPYTQKTYTHQDAFDDRVILHGIDVSQWQGNIDWQKVKAAGIDYAFIRVGYRGYGSAGTLSSSTKDTYYDKNMKGAIDAGIKVGVYIFSQAITKEEAIEEAEYILNNLGTYEVTMPLIMDFEYASTGSGLGGRLYKAKLSKSKATDICMAFCDTINAAGYTPMVYANKDMLSNHLNASTISDKYPIWLANYTTNTTYNGTFDFWQYSSTGKVDGISGKVDMNFYYAKDTDDFSVNSTSIAPAVITPVANQPYTGSSITPAVNVAYNGITLKQNVDYVVSYSNNKNIGKATLKITGKGEYRGSRTTTFNIVPKTVTGLKAKKRSTNYITLSWSKNTSGTGYQIYRSTSLNGTYKKIKTITKNKTTSYKNTKLTAGQCYYYKVRSYKKVGSTTYYGAFSTIKTIYTKTGYTRNALAKRDTNIYNMAQTTGTIVASPKKNATMSVTYYTKDEKGSGWYYVSFKSGSTTYKGFIPSGHVTITKVGKIVKASKVNLRKSYSVKSKKLTTLKRKQKVTVLSTKKKKGVTWYKVTYTKKKKTYTGWVSAPYVKIQ